MQSPSIDVYKRQIIYALLTGYTALASNYGRVPYADTGVDPGRPLAFVFSNLPRYLAVLLLSLIHI